VTLRYARERTAIGGQTVQLNNIQMYYEEHGAGKPLVLLHGFGGCAQNWYPFTAELSEHHRLIKRPGLHYRMHPMHQGRERFRSPMSPH
jgi:pimeloyl-ACP methyl ester carboxylesterase